ncbi:MAG: AAA family ATPase [Janthinobacterium lividum]
MKIRSLELQNFRKFTKPMRLTGLGDGVNVLAECNEFGKSTILAAIRGVLFERHTSRAKGVMEMRHWTHTTSPQVMLEFEREGGLYRVEKRFLHKEPFARLHMPDGSLHEGDVAEEKLQQLLGFRKPGNQGHKPEDAGMWGALWVTQLQATRLPELPEYARQTIHSCLETELGTMTGGLRGQGFLQTVERDLAKLLNGNGKPTGSYRQVLEAHAKATEHVVRLEATRDELKENVEALEKAVQRLQALEAVMRADVAEKMIAEAREKKAAAQLFEEVERNAQKDRRLTEARVAELRRKASERLARKSALEQAQKRKQAATEEKVRAAELLARAEGNLAGMQTRADEVSEASDAAAQAVRHARHVSDLAVLYAALEGLEVRLAAAEEARDKAHSAAVQVSRYRVTESLVRASEEISRSLEGVRASLDAQATQITFNLVDGVETQVQIDGAPASGTVSVVRDALVEIVGVGTIQIRPAIRDRSSVLAQLAEWERQMRTALVAMGVETLKQAREHLAAKTRAERELELHERDVRSNTPADAASGLAAGLEALTNQIALVRRRSQVELEALGLVAMPTLETAREAARLADLAELETREALTVVKAPLPVLQKQVRVALVDHSSMLQQRLPLHRQGTPGEVGRSQWVDATLT